MIASTSDDVFAELSRELGARSIDDPYPIFAQRRRTTPVMAGDIMAEFGLPARAASLDGSRPVFSFFKYDDIVEALRDSETYSSSVINEVFAPIVGRSVLGMDGPEHRTHRGLYRHAFTRQLLEVWRELILGPIAHHQADELAKTPRKRADLVQFGLRFPVRMIYEIIGFPNDEAMYEEFARSGLTMLLALSGVNPSDPDATRRNAARATAEAELLYAKVLQIVRDKRAHGVDSDDFIGHLLRAEFEGQRLNDDQITRFVRSLIPPASDTTTRSWLNVMVCLLERPDVMEEIREDRSLILSAIEEATRLEPAATIIGRITTRPVQVRGVHIPPKAGINLVTGSGSRDEDAWGDDAEEFDIHRKNKRAPLNWGFGPHLCPGMNTAKIEMAEATNALLDSLPNLRLDPDAERPQIRGMSKRSPLALPVAWD
jgi:cytochrome P450